ncbi:MAG: ATP-binding protein [Peptococcaceae bacterium]|jgi:Lon-like ATP-dependent protease|nr:AAA family ATPase [Peptococcaceae bacterium]MDH7525005.1 ATP-binding protein [Peptococcaceae bacterium]
MNRQWELKPEQLRNSCDTSVFPFKTTKDIEPFDGIAGQERAAEALEFGLKIRKYGYNIFITGATGTGRNKYSQSLVKQFAAQEPKPPDWCYLYNFEKPDHPRVVSLPAGMGREFREDMRKLIKQVMNIIPQALASERYNKEKSKFLQELQEKQNQVLASLNETARQLGFALKNTEKGIVTVPLNSEGRPMGEDEFEKLSDDDTRRIDEKSKELNMIILDTFKKLKDLEKGSQEELDRLEKRVVLSAIEDTFEKHKEKYAQYDKIGQYIEDVLKDIMKNLRLFKDKEEKAGLELLLFKDEKVRDFTHRYQVNLLIDNGKTEGAPVVVETNPTYYNLVGKVEYETQLGILTTDFMKIKPGSLHRANGGYLILQCRDLFTNIYSWNALKRALKTEKIIMENIGEQMGVIPTSTLKPEPIPLKVKVIVIGSEWEYRLLYQYDEDYRKLFKIKADFDVEMERTAGNVDKLARIICYHCKRENLRPFSSSALARIVEYSSRMADNQEKLSVRFNDLVEILYEADTWAELEKAATVTEEHVKKAIRKKIYRANKIEQKLRELIEKGVILIDTGEKTVGQVNGLAVYDLGEYSFGKPSRITVNTYVGKRGIINIEREVKLSGPIHDKGVLILSGYLGEKFGARFPLSFSASICFEQSYEGVEGDSASSAELYGLLSSLSGVPVKQGIAVTGSVNQKGAIQPIGGVNQKIEGFFQVCKIKGLTGEQGVIIPHQNIKNLMLDDEVIEAVKEGKFHVYAVKTIEEGIEILTGISWEEVFAKAQQRLLEIHECAREEKTEGSVISEAK